MTDQTRQFSSEKCKNEIHHISAENSNESKFSIPLAKVPIGIPSMSPGISSVSLIHKIHCTTTLLQMHGSNGKTSINCNISYCAIADASKAEIVASCVTFRYKQLILIHSPAKPPRDFKIQCSIISRHHHRFD